MDLEYKLSRFDILVNNYVDTINSILDLAVSNRLVPFKYLLGLPLMRDYIIKNKIDILEYGVKYLLIYKDTILNFDIKNLDDLDELDSDSNDNVSRKECVSKISKIKEEISLEKEITNELDLKKNSNLGIDSNEILNIIIEIKNNYKKLDDFSMNMFKKYIELLIIILEQIKILF
jgi:acyl carrier protein